MFVKYRCFKLFLDMSVYSCNILVLWNICECKGYVVSFYLYDGNFFCLYVYV